SWIIAYALSLSNRPNVNSQQWVTGCALLATNRDKRTRQRFRGEPRRTGISCASRSPSSWAGCQGRPSRHRRSKRHPPTTGGARGPHPALQADQPAQFLRRHRLHLFHQWGDAGLPIRFVPQAVLRRLGRLVLRLILEWFEEEGGAFRMPFGE